MNLAEGLEALEEIIKETKELFGAKKLEEIFAEGELLEQLESLVEKKLKALEVAKSSGQGKSDPPKELMSLVCVYLFFDRAFLKVKDSLGSLEKLPQSKSYSFVDLKAELLAIQGLLAKAISLLGSKQTVSNETADNLAVIQSSLTSFFKQFLTVVLDYQNLKGLSEQLGPLQQRYLSHNLCHV